MQRGEAESSAMPLLVAEASPNVFKHNGSNSLVVESGGEAPMAAADGTTEATQVTLTGPASQAAASDETPVEVTSGQTLTAFGAGLGPTDPAATTGATGEASGPTAPQRAYVGGIPATITETALSTDQVGVYELSFEVPARYCIGSRAISRPVACSEPGPVWLLGTRNCQTGWDRWRGST